MPDKEELLDVENTLHKFHFVTFFQIKDFGIELDEDIISYNMGETVKGSVILSLPKPLEFSEILLSLKGKEKSRYAKEITNRETGGKYTKQTDESYQIINMETQIIKLKPPPGDISGLDVGQY